MSDRLVTVHRTGDRSTVKTVMAVLAAETEKLLRQAVTMVEAQTAEQIPPVTIAIIPADDADRLGIVLSITIAEEHTP